MIRWLSCVVVTIVLCLGGYALADQKHSGQAPDVKVAALELPKLKTTSPMTRIDRYSKFLAFDQPDTAPQANCNSWDGRQRCTCPRRCTSTQSGCFCD